MLESQVPEYSKMEKGHALLELLIEKRNHGFEKSFGRGIYEDLVGELFKIML